jgi:hypothetical protein
MSKNGFVAYQIGKLIKNKVWIFYTLPQLEWIDNHTRCYESHGYLLFPFCLLKSIYINLCYEF